MPKLLLVDDEKEVLEEFSTYLARKGYRVTSCVNALDAIRAIRAEAPDIVLTDFRMPEMDGVELLRQLKRTHPSLPVVIMSGAADMRTAVDALNSDASDFLKKPVESKELLISLKGALDRAETALSEEEANSAEARTYGPVTHNLVGAKREHSMIHVMGPLDEHSKARVNRAFEKLFEDHVLRRGVILVFRNVTYINNIGLNFLIELRRALGARGHQVVSMQLSEKMYNYLAMLGYLEFFKVVYHLHEAIDLLSTEIRKSG